MKKKKKKQVEFKINHKHIAVIGFFLAVLGVLVFRLNSFPLFFDDFVANAVTQPVNIALDGYTEMRDVTWTWTDMNQDWAGRSPIFTAVSFLGIKIFGLTLFGVRISGVLFAFSTLLLLHYTLSQRFALLAERPDADASPGCASAIHPAKWFSFLFIALLVTSPWYLAVVRSGGIVGFGVSLVLLSVCLVTLLFRLGEGVLYEWVLPAAAGLSVAILPYGYSVTRIIAILLPVWVWIHTKQLGKKRVLVFTAAIFALLSLQIPTLPHSIKMYFNGRQETLFSFGRELPGAALVAERLTYNIETIMKYFLGLNQPEHYLNVPLASSFWYPDNVLYPKFLVPVLFLGLVLTIWHGFVKKKFIYFFPVLFLGVAILPGLLCKLGNAEQSRLSIAVLPMYYLIAYAFYCIMALVAPRIEKIFKKDNAAPAGSKNETAEKPPTPIKEKLRTASAWALGLLVGLAVLFTLSYQVNRFFAYDRSNHAQHRMLNSVLDYVEYFQNQNSDCVIAYHERPNLGIFSYVGFRLLGGPELEKKIKDGHVIPVQYDSMVKVGKMIDDKKIDVLITQRDDMLRENEVYSPCFTGLNDYIREEPAKDWVIYRKE